MRFLVAALVVVAVAAAGAGLAALPQAQPAGGDPPATAADRDVAGATPPPAPSQAPRPRRVRPRPGVEAQRPSPQRRGRHALLVRGVGELPAGVVDRLTRLPAARVVTVASGSVLLRASRDAAGDPVDRIVPGWGIPLDVAAVDPAGYARLLSRPGRRAFADLHPGRVLLGSTSARLRGLEPGAALDLGPRTLRVAGVVHDTLVGSAEAVLHPTDAAAVGVEGVRYVIAAATGPRAPALSREVDRMLSKAGGVLVSRLAPGSWPAAWREVLPQAHVKQRFGEFAIRPGAGREVTLEPGWTDAHIQTAAVPLLGQVRCHRAILSDLAAALAELQRRRLGHLVDPGDYGGCFSPRLIAAGASVSRHAWGIAVDLNAAGKPFGAASTQDPRLVAVMRRHGFGFGGLWPVPDAMHFEHRGRAAR